MSLVKDYRDAMAVKIDLTPDFALPLKSMRDQYM